MAVRKGASPLQCLGIAVLLLGGANEGRAAFSCGSHLFTYGVTAPDGSPARGVRCVRFVDRRSFTWYGEGQWGDAIYRHLGYAIGPLEVVTAAANVFTGSAADFSGNGETTNGNFPGNLQISIPNPPAQPAWDATTAPQRISVSGAWNETWILRSDGAAPDWDSLGPVRQCGPHMEEFSVSPGTDDDRIRNVGDDRIWGVRCLLNADGKRPAAWYGEGEWGAGGYRHIGTAFFGIGGPEWGASDICQQSPQPRPPSQMFCGATRFGDLRFRRANEDRSIRVTGSWNEWWDR